MNDENYNAENLDEVASANHEDEKRDDEGGGTRECNSSLGRSEVSGDDADHGDGGGGGGDGGDGDRDDKNDKDDNIKNEC